MQTRNITTTGMNAIMRMDMRLKDFDAGENKVMKNDNARDSEWRAK